MAARFEANLSGQSDKATGQTGHFADISTFNSMYFEQLSGPGSDDGHFQFATDHCFRTRATENLTPIEQGNYIKNPILKIYEIGLALRCPSMQTRSTAATFFPPTPSTDLRPFLLKGIGGSLCERQPCGDKIARAIKELHRRRVFLSATEGDSHPIQALAPAHCSKQPQLGTRADHSDRDAQRGGRRWVAGCIRFSSNSPNKMPWTEVVQ
jgi:hypothetical protein